MDILHIATAGSVDDGKSTLIGRLLFETNSITEDKLEAIEKASKRRGTEYTDLSLLTDGLIAEREQGITIDVAHIYFHTPHRKYIIADTPGHIEYTRNMVTGASNAQVAIILIDARHGIVEQTYRHFYITQILRIQHVIVCVNKMDLVQYDQQVFQKHVDTFQQLRNRSLYKDQQIYFLPCSALYGENIARRGLRLGWFKGATLLDHLEQIEWKSSEHALPARFPIQYVIRPKMEAYHDFRGLAGKIQSGTFRVGETVKVLPSGKTTTIRQIYVYQQEKKNAVSGQNVVITLDDDLDISRGDMIVAASSSLQSQKTLQAQLCWLDEVPLLKGKTYLLQHGTHRVKAKVSQLHGKIDLHQYELMAQTDRLSLNEIGLITLQLAQSVHIDSYQHLRNNGRFILIDEASNHTVAVGFAEISE
jgi:sulfate adenylyltransferase subunit 1